MRHRRGHLIEEYLDLSADHVRHRGGRIGAGGDISTLYRYVLPVEETHWKFQSASETTFTWEYDARSEGRLRLYAKGKQQRWDAHRPFALGAFERIGFHDALPRTGTWKPRRFKLRNP